MPAPTIPGTFVHVVFFWLKNPDNAEDRASFEKSLKTYIQSSPFISSMHIGQPAQTPRDVVDNSWTYNLVLSFADKEAHDNYQTEPGHLTFIEEASDLWEKVIVYDSLLNL